MGDTTDGQVLVGIDGDTDAYATLNVAAGAESAIGDTFNTSNDADAITEQNLPADTQVEITAVVSTGGVPAGIGTPYAVIGWYK